MSLLIKLVLFSVLLVLMTMSGILYEYQRFISTPLHVDEEGYVYTVAPGSNLSTISQDLQTSGLSNFPSKYLYFYGRLEDKAHLIRAGEYLIQPNTTAPQFLEQLISGQVIQYPFTIIEGTTSQQLIDAVIADKRFKTTFIDNTLSTVMQAIGRESSHGEGEFAPETYYFSAGTTDSEILSRAYALMKLNLEQLWQDKAKDLPYKTPYEALIMASIIEKETGIAEERAEIAGVFVRRLKKGMRLQTDPTVIYGMGDKYKGNIRRKDLKQDTPYNTYTRYGLPPTPIALPSKAAIEAALHPADGKSLYFVATGQDGRHVFSDTLNAHNKAVRKYQLKK